MAGDGEKPKRTRKKMNFVLGWVNESEPEVDESGKVVAPSRRCFVEMDLPPGLEGEQARNRAAIKRACKKAVFEHGLKEFGNKELVVLSFDDFFSVPFEEKTVTRLCPPE